MLTPKMSMGVIQAVTRPELFKTSDPTTPGVCYLRHGEPLMRLGQTVLTQPNRGLFTIEVTWVMTRHGPLWVRATSVESL